jgi:nitrogen regulatory protein PII
MQTSARLEGPTRPLIRRCGIALLFVVGAFVPTLLLQHLFPYPFLFLFFGAVMASAWFGETAAGLFAVMLSTVLVEYFFVPPFYSFSISTTAEAYFAAFVACHGRQKGHTESYRGREYEADLLPKVKLELVLEDKLVDSVIDAIVKTASTGKIGDGKIFLWKVDEAIRIRNQERGAAAL